MNNKTLSNSLSTGTLLCRAEFEEQGRPIGIVANSKGTLLYSQYSGWGRVWSIIHNIRGSGNMALAKAIRFAAGNLMQLSNERQKFCEIIEAEGALGEFWKTHSVAEIHTSIEKHLKISFKFRPPTAQLENLLTSTRWADQQLGNSDKAVFNEKALKAFESASSLETLARATKKVEIAETFNQRWIKLGGCHIAPLETLFRELTTVYPDNDEQLFQKRDKLQKKLGYSLGGKGSWWQKAECPPELLFGPLIKIASAISRQESFDINNFKDFFNSLNTYLSEKKRLEMQKTASKILSLVGHLRKTSILEKPADIPDLIIEKLADKAYLDKTGLSDSYAAEESDCCKVGGGTRSKIVSGMGVNRFGYTPQLMIVQVPIPFQHRRSYYQYHKAQDGTETLKTFDTYSPAG